LNRLGIQEISETIQKSKSIGASHLVSVIIPTFNRDWSIGRCVSSVFEQTYQPIECIVVDDGSTDDTPQIVERISSDAPKEIELRLIRKENGGANSARNRGLIECKGEYICFLDSDDWLLPDSVKTRADILIADPNVDFCYGLCSVQDENGNELRKMNSPWPKQGEARIAPYLFQTDAPLIRRSICAKAGLWREDDTYAAQEYEYFARIKFFSGKVIFIDRVLNVYSKHSNGQIYSPNSRKYTLSMLKLTLIVKGLLLYSKYDSNLERNILSKEFKEIGKRFYKMKDFKNACMALEESWLLSWTMRCFLQWCCVRVLCLYTKRWGAD
jgi:glycosyltransferase involved in cell wall biosynthesis